MLFLQHPGFFFQIHHHKFEFNQSFLALREKKVKIIKQVRQDFYSYRVCFTSTAKQLPFLNSTLFLFQMKETVKKLEEVQRKIDPYSKRPIPKIPEMMPDECPEK